MEPEESQRDALGKGIPPEDSASFVLFAYGSLKRGLIYHDQFCGGATHIEEATVRGNLYDLPFGFPAVVVPAEDVRATGTGNPIQDATVAWHLGAGEAVQVPDGPRVSGEAFIFDDPEDHLPALDRLEGFDPDGQSLYRRVLIPVELPESKNAILGWAYVMDKPSGIHLTSGYWPPD